MDITIIVADNSVGKDGIFYYGLDLPSCNIPSNVRCLQWSNTTGHIEFKDASPNQSINELPDWAESCVEKWEEEDYAHKNPPAPTPEEILAFNKLKAKGLLLDSDWAMLPDVALQNKEAWQEYRAAIRPIALEPILDPVWPVKPPVIWA